MPIVVSCTAEKRSNKLSKSALSSAFKNCRGSTFGKAVWSDDTDEGDDEDEEDVVPEEPDEVVTQCWLVWLKKQGRPWKPERRS